MTQAQVLMDNLTVSSTIEPDDIDGLILAARAQVCKGMFESLTTSTRLMDEGKELQSKSLCYEEMCDFFNQVSKPTMRIHILKKSVEIKFNITEATRTIFTSKLQQAEYKRRKVVDSLCPQIRDGSACESLSEEEKKGVLQRIEKDKKDITEVNDIIQNLKKDWEDIKDEMISVFDDCIHRVYQFIVEVKRRR
ncbi:hypothetical protein Ocin01_08572 [Orchesella cincta]|uniref:Uncharacterized protein n=1 Tax=Orchesella cincta TaxID=48709 RepID=A0A1D2MZ78_ORCCI|nr:hypothetical protein Ocin01_08572 [Orchesella cincta]